jgi:hypothetical protein
VASLILRDSTFYIQYMVSGKAKRLSTGTDSLQIAKAKLRQFEDAKANGSDNPLPTAKAPATTRTISRVTFEPPTPATASIGPT